MSRHRRRGQRLLSRRGGPSSFPLGIDNIITAGAPRGSENEKCTACSASLGRCRSMSLKAQHEACRREYEANAEPRAVDAVQRKIQALAETGIVAQAVKACETVPLFELRCGRGGFIDLSDLLNRGPVIISFFWGDWCPFCVLELKALAAAHPEIEAPGRNACRSLAPGSRSRVLSPP